MPQLTILAGNNVGCYNTSQSLWDNYFKSYPNTKVTIVQGHVHVKGEGYLARFPTQEAAEACIIAAQKAALPPKKKAHANAKK